MDRLKWLFGALESENESLSDTVMIVQGLNQCGIGVFSKRESLGRKDNV
jgi:hypothetical protein